jgi:tetratricopeptide (TPR) repeat protein
VQVALGDSRKLFAKHVFLKADAYFHNGYYPTIYDNNEGYEKAHIVEDMHESAEESEANFLGKPKDWLDAFSRNFYPTRHRHLSDPSGHDDQGKAGGDAREILPWLRLSAELDPEHVETYVVSAYWLRTSLKKVDEAEQFLREGLRANPGDHEILFELGCIYNENRQDPARARNLWELGLKSWRERESSKKDPNVFVYARTLGNLATLEEKQTNYARALELLAPLKSISPNRDAIEKWMADLKGKLAK